MKIKKILIIVTFSLFIFILFNNLSTTIHANPTFIKDDFTDELMIRKIQGLEIDTEKGEIFLARCYQPISEWTFIETTEVRDIEGKSTDTVTKDIYCDNEACILWTHDPEPDPSLKDKPGNSVCIGQDINVYANILWAKEDQVAAKWGDANYNTQITSISGYQIGGIIPAGSTAGSNNNIISGNFLNRYYNSRVDEDDKFPAMDACKQRGSGWRLPTIIELDSIRDQSKEDTPRTHLPNISSLSYHIYLTSSERTEPGIFGISAGGSIANLSKDSNRSIRCVRDY